MTRLSAPAIAFAAILAVAGAAAAAAQVPTGGATASSVAEPPASPAKHSESRNYKQNVKFTAELDNTRPVFGTPVKLTVMITRPKGTGNYRFPKQPDWGPFLEAKRNEQTLMAGAAEVMDRLEMTLRVLEIGKAQIPEIRLVREEGSQLEAITTPAFDLEALPPPQPAKGEAALRDIAGPVTVMVADYGLVFGAGLLAAVGILAWMARRLKRAQAVKPAPAPPPPPPEPAHVEALRRLKEIEAQKLLENGEVQRYFYEVSEVVRNYLGKRFSFDALEMTTSEFLDTLKLRRTPGLDYARAEQFLHFSDLVKFADHRPSSADCARLFNDAHEFIERTAPLTPPGAAVS